jgi:hypothetical protein
LGGGALRKEDFFFEKKEAKNFHSLEPRRSDRHSSHVQKFFASFFQKRSPSLAKAPQWY